MRYIVFSMGYFFLILLTTCLGMSSANNITTDQHALLAFKNHITSNAYQILSTNWSVSTSVCEWIGVTCGSHHRRVTALNVSYMGLSDTIPPQLGSLSFLISLDITGNNFHGELPNELSHLRRLKALKFSINNLSGEIPSWLGSLHELQVLYLTNNTFTGSIPTSISNLSKLEGLSLSFNYLQGSIQNGIGSLQNLKGLIIEYNQISGSVPYEMFNISSLQIIALMSNNLFGNLPMSICNRLKKLKWLSLSHNKLNGQIPFSLSQCSELQILSLSFNEFGGFIPEEIGSLKLLEGLYLSYNNLEEYGLQGLVSPKCDVYSYGIMMMEVFTRTKPSDVMFDGDLSLRSWVSNSMPNGLAQVIDANVLNTDEISFNQKMESLNSLMEVALNCTKESPRERSNMKDVLVALKKIKLRLSTYIGREGKRVL